MSKKITLKKLRLAGRRYEGQDVAFENVRFYEAEIIPFAGMPYFRVSLQEGDEEGNEWFFDALAEQEAHEEVIADLLRNQHVNVSGKVVSINGGRSTHGLIISAITPVQEEQPEEDEFDQNEEESLEDQEQTGPRDVTDLIERMDPFEARLGIRLEALTAYVGKWSTGVSALDVMGEVYAAKGDSVSTDFYLRLIAYDMLGRVIATTNNMPYDSSTFFKFECFHLQCLGLPTTEISKIRIKPET